MRIRFSRVRDASRGQIIIWGSCHITEIRTVSTSLRTRCCLLSKLRQRPCNYHFIHINAKLRSVRQASTGTVAASPHSSSIFHKTTKAAAMHMISANGWSTKGQIKWCMAHFANSNAIWLNFRVPSEVSSTSYLPGSPSSLARGAPLARTTANGSRPQKRHSKNAVALCQER